MNKELKGLLDKISAKKEEIKNLANENKIEDAKAAKEELKNLSDKFNLLYDLYEEQEEKNKEQVKDKANEIKENKKDEVLNSFVNVIKSTFAKEPINEKDIKILNSMKQKSDADGGLIVPQDLRTQIQELRRSEDALESLVNVEPVSTISGSRVLEVNADQVPFDNVDEEAQFPEVSTPTFRKISYKVVKKGGILKVTRELVQDSSENILGYLRKWISKKAKATRNYLILDKLDKTFGTSIKAVSNVDDLKKIFNIELDPAIAVSSSILTNQDGFNWLDTLKDTDGKYILQPNPIQATQRLLFGKYPVMVVSNKTLKSTGNKAPIYCGDFKEAVTIFDRENLSIEFSTEAGDLWGKDLTGIKVRERLDIQSVDTEAVIKAEVTFTKANSPS